MGGDFSGEEMRAGLVQPLLSALRASHFLLLRQKKVSKEKATPGYAVGCADSPALLETGGGCGTRATPSDSPRPFSAGLSVALRFTRGPGKASPRNPQDSFLAVFPSRPQEAGISWAEPSRRDDFRVPMRGAEQHRRAGGSRLALFEPQASSGKPPGPTSSARNPKGADLGVAFSLATFFWRSKRKYARPQGGTQRLNKPLSPEQSSQPC